MALLRDAAREASQSLPSIGLIGTGYEIRCVVPVLRSLGFTIAAAWGNNAVKVKSMAECLNIPFYTTKIDDLLVRNEVDLVCVFCPLHQRADATVKALLIGKNVLCEGPAGLDRYDAQRMVDASQYYPKLLSLIAYNLRYLPAFVKMRELISEGYCGELAIFDCRLEMGSLLGDKYNWLCDHVTGGGVLNIRGSHFIDLSQYLTGQKAVEVHGVLKTFNKHTEKINGFRHITSDDFTCFQMKLEKGCFANVSLNTLMPGKFQQEVTVAGTKGRLVVRNGDLYGMSIDQSSEEKLLYKETGRAHVLPNIENPPAEIDMLAFEAWLQDVKKSFLCFQDHRSSNLDVVAKAAKFDDGFYVRAVLDAIIQSSNTQEWVKVVLERPNVNKQKQF